MAKSSDIEFYYDLLMEGRMDMMHLPSGAVAWLWQYDRPESQTESASQFAMMAHDLGDPVIDAALLRADTNILVLHMQSGNRVSVYPDGGMGSNGEPIAKDPSAFHAFITGQSMEPEMGAVMAMPDELGVDPVMDPIGDPVMNTMEEPPLPL